MTVYGLAISSTFKFPWLPGCGCISMRLKYYSLGDKMVHEGSFNVNVFKVSRAFLGKQGK